MIKRLASIIFITLALFTVGCNNVKGPEFRSVENFKIETAGLVTSRVRLDVQLYNPNNFSVRLKETVGNFYVDSTYLGQLTQDSIISVAANSSFLIPLTGTIQVKNLLNNGMAMLLNKKVLIRAEGSTRVGKGSIFVNYPFQFQEMQSLDFLR